MRTYSLEKVLAATSQYYDGNLKGFNPEKWLQHSKNVALINENDDIALFEHQADMSEGTVCGHYFFHSRGKQAIKTARSFLEEIFSEEYDVESIIGLTPVEHKGALWMNKRLGFKEHGTIDTVEGPHMFVLLTKQQWKDSK